MQSKQQGLFEEYRQCAICGRRLPATYEGEFCPACVNLNLLRNVKDFIRDNDVNEYQVASHFDIPLRMVRDWIREGRIEYKPQSETNQISAHCQRCGAPVTFGTLCQKCLKLLNEGNIKGYGKAETSDNEKMRFLDDKK